MMHRPIAILIAALLAILPVPLVAQGMNIPFAGFDHDPAEQVEVTADELSVNQADGTAVFSGNVVVGQGTLRLAAQSVQVEYAAQAGRIARLHAKGGVTLTTEGQAAEAEEAIYDIDARQVVMQGEVMLTDGPNAIAGDRLVVDLDGGTGRMEGRVRTVLQSGAE